MFLNEKRGDLLQGLEGETVTAKTYTQINTLKFQRETFNILFSYPKYIFF